MDDVEQQSTATGTKTKVATSAYSQPSGAKHAENRMANKQRKKRAHKRNLKRPNSNG
jgi:hypothetical protein